MSKVFPDYYLIDKRASALIETAGGENPDDLLRTAELAGWLGLSKQWCEIARCRGYGPPWIRLGPKLVFYKRSAVLAWLEQRVNQRADRQFNGRTTGSKVVNGRVIPPLDYKPRVERLSSKPTGRRNDK